MHDVFLKPPKELGLEEGSVLRLLKPLYGLAESGDYWVSTNATHHAADLGMEPSIGDLSLYFKRSEGSLIGILGIVVDDTLQCGTEEFWEVTSQTLNRFKCKDRVTEAIVFAGIHVDKRGDGYL